MKKDEGSKNANADDIKLSDIDDHGHKMEIVAAAAFARMAEDCEKATGNTLIVNSAFRSHEDQQRLWRRYERQFDVWKTNKSLPEPLRPSYPGKSKHEVGVAVDIDLKDDAGNDRSYAAWLCDHAHEYGFKTPIRAEPWHHEFQEVKET